MIFDTLCIKSGCKYVLLVRYFHFLECCSSQSQESKFVTSRSADTDTNQIEFLPLFKWVNCSEHQTTFAACMEVVFPLNNEKDVLLLKNYEEESSVLEGCFQNELNVQVSVVINNSPSNSSITVRYFTTHLRCCFLIIKDGGKLIELP